MTRSKITAMSPEPNNPEYSVLEDITSPFSGSGGSHPDHISVCTDCAGADPSTWSTVILGQADLAGPVPLTGDVCRFYTLTLETDGDPNNDWQPNPAYPWDYYQATDHWFVLDYTPDTGWTAIAQSVTTSQSIITSGVDFQAAIVEDRVYWLIDGSSFPSPVLGYRFATFYDPSCAYDLSVVGGDVSGDLPTDPLLTLPMP